MKKEYFKFSQAPLVYISYESDMFDEYIPELTTEIEENEFRNNKHMQIVVIDLKFTGSLI